MFAKGRQPSEWSAKREFQKINPNAVCRRWGVYDGKTYFAVLDSPDSNKPLVIRPTAEAAWEAAYIRRGIKD